MGDLEVSADAEEFEDDWDQIVAWAARPQTDFGGAWVPASIFGDMLFWNEGEEVSIEVLSSKKFSMCYVGVTYVAELSDDGTLHWDDGDVWCHRDSVTCKKNDMQTCDQNLSHKDLKFDGVWGPAYLKEGNLTWNEGETVQIDVLSDTQFRMVYVGKTYSAELRSDGKLYWSDGDRWSRQSISHSSLSAGTDGSQDRRSIGPVATTKIAPSTLSTGVGKVPNRNS